MAVIRSLAALVCATSLALAQGATFTSYPQDTTSIPYGTYASFGTNATGGADETAFQQLIPAEYLPGTGTPVIGMQVVANFTGNVTYSYLQITLAHGVTRKLSRTFAQNLANPVVVLGGNDITLTFAKSGWAKIYFAQPFFYDGKSDLVIEIRKVIDRAKHPPAFSGILSMQTRGNPVRKDLPLPVYDFGAFGSGAAQATTSRLSSYYPMSTRLDWGGSPTLVLKSDPGGTSGGSFAVGTTYDHTIQGPSGSPYANLFGVGFAATPLSHPLLVGLGYLDLSTSVSINSGNLGAATSATISLPIPNAANLVGLQPTFQSVVIDAGTLKWTNAADGIVNQ